MVKLRYQDSLHVVPNAPQHAPINELDDSSTVEDEIDAIVASLAMMDALAEPDLVIQSCMAYMARLTEIHLQLTRIEGKSRKAKVFKTTQLERVMDLVEFEYRGASRLIEVRRQEVDLSR